MAAVHSMETPPQGLLGAYRCMICRFMSPLYTGKIRLFYRSFWANLVFLELIRHYNEYHSRSGWLLCPLCLRVFSNDTTYEHHMNTHITKGRFFRCQSCRLVFESENFRTRHEQEMHHSNRKNPAIPQARLRFLVIPWKSVKSTSVLPGLCSLSSLKGIQSKSTHSCKSVGSWWSW